MINSITGKKERFAQVLLPLAQKPKAKIDSLYMDDIVIPNTVGERMAVGRALHQNRTRAGVLF